MRSPDDITTAADLDEMTPAERHADFESRIVTNLDALPPDAIEQIRAYHLARLTERGVIRAS
jgi:hypothetical protein